MLAWLYIQLLLKCLRLHKLWYIQLALLEG